MVKNRNVCAMAIGLLVSLQTINAEHVEPGDTLKTYAIDEVVVTSSTKETNDFRTLPGAVSVISPQSIYHRQIDALKDISSYVPNLYIPDYGAKLTSAIYLRGIGARSSGQSIGLYVDNAPYPDKSTFDFELTDIQRIEVLRGPQGTLYGRNAMGGIVNIYTFSPLDYQGTKLLFSAGNYGQFKAKASHYTKLGKTVGLSLSGYYDRNDGYFTNIHTGKKADGEESAGGRFKLDWRITPQLLASYALSYDYTGQGAFPYGLYDRETGRTEPVNIGDSSRYTRNMLSNHLLLEYKTAQFVLTSTTGYQTFNDDMLMDQDFSPATIFVLNQKQKQKAWSEEIAIKSNTDRNYQWSFGLYGFHNTLHTDGPVTFKEDGMQQIFQKEVFDALKEKFPAMPTLLVADKELRIPGSFDTPTYGAALFHQSTYNNLFTKGLSITAGIRLDYEKQEMTYNSEAQMNLNISIRPGMPPMAVPVDPTVMDVRTSQSFKQLLPKLSLKYECTPATFTYLSVAKGYKTGGYNVQMSADLMQSQMQYDLMNKYMKDLAVEPLPVEKVTAYAPESSWNYEMGVRSELIPGWLNAELTLFYMDIRDMQITKFVDSGNGRYLANAGKAKSYGVEASLRARISEGLTADLNYGYTHAAFRNYVHESKDSKTGVVRTDCDGNFIPYTPRHTLNIGLHYNRFFRNAWIDQFYASAQMSGAGNIYWTETNDIKQPFYALLNMKTGVRKGIVSASLWSRNLTATDYAAFYFESRNTPFIQKGKPLQVGAEISLTF